MTARTDHGKFVAAARWAKVNGWTYDRTDMGDLREHRWRKDAWHVHLYDECLAGSESSGMRFELHPTSVKQAIDHLVTADVLPVEFHSLAPKEPEPEPEVQVCRFCLGGKCVSCCPFVVIVTDSMLAATQTYYCETRAQAEARAAYHNRIFATRQTYGGHTTVVELCDECRNNPQLRHCSAHLDSHKAVA